jgi:hypothetical protein
MPVKPYVAGVVIVVTALVVIGILVVLQPADRGAGSASTSPPASQSSPGPSGVLAVKIDNIAAARPSTGVGGADTVYVEPVEGGLTRLVALYPGARPPTVGPVRSARLTDISLLARFTRPALAYSGAAPPVLAQLHASPILGASPADEPQAYTRSARPMPHNLYLHPARLRMSKPGAGHPLWRVGAAPAGGTSLAAQQVRFPAASFTFSWSASTKVWRISMDGAPYVDTAAGQLGASTVIVQQVATTQAPGQPNPAHPMAPTAETVGHGPAIVLRDGKRFAADWSRPSPAAPTTLTTGDGQAIRAAAGKTWVLLVPQPLRAATR